MKDCVLTFSNVIAFCKPASKCRSKLSIIKYKATIIQGIRHFRFHIYKYLKAREINESRIENWMQNRFNHIKIKIKISKAFSTLRGSRRPIEISANCTSDSEALVYPALLFYIPFFKFLKRVGWTHIENWWNWIFSQYRRSPRGEIEM